MANETLQAHGTYYMDGQMVILSVGCHRWVLGCRVETVSVWRETLQSPLLAVEEVQPGSFASDRGLHTWNAGDLGRHRNSH